MSVIFLLIPLSVIIAIAFLGAFIWAVRSGQYEDTYTPSLRLLLEEPKRDPLSPSSSHQQATGSKSVKSTSADSEGRLAINEP